MNMLSINPAVNFKAYRKLVPISEYKGEILKLTPADKKQIAHLEREAEQYELEINRICEYMKNPKNVSADSTYFYEQIDKLEYRISGIRKRVREIKLERLALQKAQHKH